MKKNYLLALLVFCFLLMSCNSIGGKDTIVARIGNETLYAEDLDFLALQKKTGPFIGEHKAAVERLFFSLALASKAEGESSSYDSAWKAYEPMVKNRLLTIAYTKFHLTSRLGYTDDELKKFFEEHRNEFDSTASYFQVRNEVAGRYYLSKNQDSLKAFIHRFIREKDEPAKVDLLFSEGDSTNALNETSSDARSVTIVQGRETGIFADSSVIRALFLADSMSVGETRKFQVMQDSLKVNFVLKLQKRVAPVVAREEDYKDELERDFITQRKLAISREVKELMEDMGAVVVEPLKLKDPRKFYEEHIEKFMTAPGYEVYHVAMKDSAVLAKTMVNVKDLESFKAVAATISEKEETSENNGFVGHVKKEHALPYGIGMMPSLWTELEGKSEGYISSALRSVSDSLYHCFYLSKIVPPEAKPFDRVEKWLEKVYAEDVEGIDPSTVLVSKNGVPVYTKADLMKIFDAEAGIPYNKDTHNNIVRMLAQAYAVGEKAKSENVDRSWEYRALMRSARIDFINSRYSRVPASSEKKELSENQKKYEYYVNKSSYEGMSYEEALPKIEDVFEFRTRMNQKMLSNLEAWNKANVFFYDRSKMDLVPVTTAEGFLALGDSSAKVQNVDKAIYAYQKVIDLFAERDSLFRTAVYNLAQVYSDAQRYKESVECFEAFLQVWPDAPEVEKAMFSLGFVLNENLKQNDRALEVLGDFQKRFPKSELKESVDWLVENIKSDGKLADDLMKKIEAEE